MTMTMTQVSTSMRSASTVNVPGAGVTEFLSSLRSARLHSAWVRYWNYRTTLSSLSSQSDETLRDLGLNRADLATIAHHTAYGH